MILALGSQRQEDQKFKVILEHSEFETSQKDNENLSPEEEKRLRDGEREGRREGRRKEG